MQQLSKWIMLLGAILIITGALLYFLDGKLNWFGRLPGDIRLEKENFQLYFPISTMIIISIILSAIIWLIQRFFK